MVKGGVVCVYNNGIDTRIIGNLPAGHAFSPKLLYNTFCITAIEKSCNVATY